MNQRIQQKQSKSKFWLAQMKVRVIQSDFEIIQRLLVNYQEKKLQKEQFQKAVNEIRSRDYNRRHYFHYFLRKMDEPQRKKIIAVKDGMVSHDFYEWFEYYIKRSRNPQITQEFLKRKLNEIRNYDRNVEYRKWRSVVVGNPQVNLLFSNYTNLRTGIERREYLSNPINKILRPIVKELKRIQDMKRGQTMQIQPNSYVQPNTSSSTSTFSMTPPIQNLNNPTPINQMVRRPPPPPPQPHPRIKQERRENTTPAIIPPPNPIINEKKLISIPPLLDSKTTTIKTEKKSPPKPSKKRKERPPEEANEKKDEKVQEPVNKKRKLGVELLNRKVFENRVKGILRKHHLEIKDKEVMSLLFKSTKNRVISLIRHWHQFGGIRENNKKIGLRVRQAHTGSWRVVPVTGRLNQKAWESNNLGRPVFESEIRKEESRRINIQKLDKQKLKENEERMKNRNKNQVAMDMLGVGKVNNFSSSSSGRGNTTTTDEEEKKKQRIIKNNHLNKDYSISRGVMNFQIQKMDVRQNPNILYKTYYFQKKDERDYSKKV